MAPKIIKAPKITKRPAPKKLGSSPGSGGLGPWLGGVRNNPAIVPGVREQ